MACILLPLSFAYDVFWVFLEPMLMGGPSVMVEVGLCQILETPLFPGFLTLPAHQWHRPMRPSILRCMKR